MGRRYATDDVEPYSGEPTRRLKPSDRLTGRPRAIFLHVVSTTAAGHFRSADQELLERYAEAQALAEMAAAKLFGVDGPVDADGKLSAWFQVHTVASRTASSLATRLRLTVLARSPKAVKTQAGPMSYYDEMRLEMEGNNGDEGVDGGRP
jgi:hypothetical protein